jgi:molybdopterin-synthase adenylyltransferase
MTTNRFSRQSFLGENSQDAIEAATVGVAGLGGGGGHFVQQLAHVGFLDFVIYDGDTADDSNLNRLVTATEIDAKNAVPKTELARRRILSIRSDARVEVIPKRWQEQPESLRRCDIVFGAVDGFAERRELEITCRRYMIPLIDIGMDVHQVEGAPPRMGGQAILSMPGSPCMTCLGFLNEAALAREAERYGAAGPRPQVVWPNGALASTAIGIGINLLTDWTKTLRGPVYLLYNGNDGSVTPHPRLVHLHVGECPHFPTHQIGDPVFKRL